MASFLKKYPVQTTVVAGAGFAGLVWIWHQRLRRNKQELNIQNENEAHDTSPNITVVDSVEQWNDVKDDFLHEAYQYGMLGLDCEWLSRDQRGDGHVSVALLQLATPTGWCLLVRTCHVGVPDELRTLLADRKVFKLGVACIDDGRRLERDFSAQVTGCLDLRNLVFRAIRRLPQSLGLQSLAEFLIDVKLNKSPRIRCSDWETDTLSQEQLNYAALDALVSVWIMAAVHLHKRDNMPVDELKHQQVQKPRDVEFWQDARCRCQGLIDVPHANARQNRQQGAGDKTKRQKVSGRCYVARQRPLYHNCVLEAPDGQMLCTCDERKIQWYIDKEIGDLIDDNPLTVRLRFEPSGRPTQATWYYLMDKQNRCVVCGKEKEIIRKNIIPREYRKFFPAVMKDHRSHDVLPMCPPCHETSCRLDLSMRRSLASECDAPLTNATSQKPRQDPFLMRVKSSARALRKSRAQLPEARLLELEGHVMQYFNCDEITADMLDQAAGIETRGACDEDEQAHGERVVRYYTANAGLIQLERRWRQHFLDAMRPRFMPELWSVDHTHEKLLSLADCPDATENGIEDGAAEDETEENGVDDKWTVQVDWRSDEETDVPGIVEGNLKETVDYLIATAWDDEDD